MRLVTALAFSFVVCASGVAQAEHHHKDWWKYLEGSWSYVTDADEKGEVTWEQSAEGNATIAQWKGDDGTRSTSLAGWRADKGMEVTDGYGSAGNFWHIEWNKTVPNGRQGKHSGQTAEGISYSGTIVVKKIDDDNWRWDFNGDTEDGETLTMWSKLTRKK